MVAEPGVYMQVLEEELQKRNLEIPIMTMEEAISLLDNIIEKESKGVRE